MPIGKALLLKGLGGLAAIGGTIGGGCYLYDYFSNQDTKFDRGLIEFLEADDSTNIQFSVKEGNTEISDSFPTFTTSTPPKTATVTIKVSVGTATGNDGGTLTEKSGAAEGSKAKKTYLQNLNKSSTQGATGTDWTWICEIKFTVENVTDASTLTLADKEKLVKSTESKGFFNKLKEADTNNKKNKDLKIKFIKDCATNRGKDKNKEINKKESLDVIPDVITTANEIKSTKEFKLIKGEGTNLIPKDKSDFNYWFGITNN